MQRLLEKLIKEAYNLSQNRHSLKIDEGFLVSRHAGNILTYRGEKQRSFNTRGHQTGFGAVGETLQTDEGDYSPRSW